MHKHCVAGIHKTLASQGARTPRKGKDTAMSRTHAGLVSLTGKMLPAKPEQWNAVVQAGAVIAPEPTWIDNTVQTIGAWVKH